MSSSRRWDKAPRWIQDRASSQALKTYLVIGRLTSGQPRRLSKRLLASRRGVSTKTIYNHICELIAAKVLRAEYAKVGPCRNAPNRYILLDIDGGDLHLHMERNCTEKLLQPLKPKATARDARRMENHPPMVRKLYNLVGRLYRQRHKTRAESKGHAYRLQAAEDRKRRALAAELGVYTGQKTEMSDAEAQELRQRIAGNERKSRDRIHRQDGGMNGQGSYRQRVGQGR